MAFTGGNNILDLIVPRRVKMRTRTHRQQEHTMNQTFTVTGMTCSHCERAVNQAIRSVDPQAQIKIDLPSGKVEVQSAQPREMLAQAIAGEGYGVA